MTRSRLLVAASVLAVAAPLRAAETVALWLFDEPAGLYPSQVLDSSAGLDAPLVLGLGGQVVAGHFGQALSGEPYPPIVLPETGEKTAALGKLPVPPGRTQAPLTWPNAQFAALMTGGENHLRKEVSFVNPTASDLNLGDFDWTVEFWLRVASPRAPPGVIFEIGTGPRGENDQVTRLSVAPADGEFVFRNQPANLTLHLACARAAFDGKWHHFALVYGTRDATLRPYVDGQPQPAVAGRVRRLPEGKESYLTLARDGTWGEPLAGSLDEMRFSRGIVYPVAFTPPASFAPAEPPSHPVAGLPLLFAGPRSDAVIALGSRKHLFIDAALIDTMEGITFVPKPPQKIECVMPQVSGQFRKHLTVIEDAEGLIRLYNGGPDDYLMVHVSRDGKNFTDPDTGLHHAGAKNIVIAEPAPLGRPIIDPNGPADARWKYLSGLEGRGVYLYTSPDGWKWSRVRTAAAPFRSGSQSSFFFDDQRGVYVAFHRSGFGATPGGATLREFVRVETADPYHPWPFVSQTQAEVQAIAQRRSLRKPQPWWLDNGPLTPGDFGIEYPVAFTVDPAIDRPGDGIYVPKAAKYPWAPDTYVAFPAMYHQYGEGSVMEKLLVGPRLLLTGSGEFETQLAVSRDGVNWHRYPKPAYVPALTFNGHALHQIYTAEGLIRRGDEIWQYFYGQEDYHSTKHHQPDGNGVYRMVQRLDGFVAAESAPERLGRIVTRPLIFTGRRLELNLDAGTAGSARVALLDAAGREIPGYRFADCVPLTGSATARAVEWKNSGADVAALAGQTVRVAFELRGVSLYALQFVSQ